MRSLVLLKHCIGYESIITILASLIATCITEFMKQVFPMFLRPLAPPDPDDEESGCGLSSFSRPFCKKNNEMSLQLSTSYSVWNSNVK